ncbi:MAG: RidA family protein [Actinomycetota bacterium]|nr:RidA family protein [Actinomycetota bacterium]
MTGHEIVNPETLAPPVGFAHAVVASGGKTVYLGGQAGMTVSGDIVAPGLPEQFDTAAANIVTALEAAGGEPNHLVSMQIFVTSAEEYRRSLKKIGEIYRKHFGRHYPALAFFEVSGLFDRDAKVELWCVAVIPDG